MPSSPAHPVYGPHLARLRQGVADQGVTPLVDPAIQQQLLARLMPGSAGTQVVRTPLTDTALLELAHVSPGEVAHAFERARVAQQAWQSVPLARRCSMLMRLHDLVVQHHEFLLAVCVAETGKSLLHAMDEVLHVALTARYYGRTAYDHLATKRRKGIIPGLTKVQERRVPRGVVGIISPWNYPLTLSLCDGLAALAAGNTVVIKPDDRTVLSALVGAWLLEQAGFPREVWQVVAGPGPLIGTELTKNADYMCFTGSTTVGRQVAALCANRLIGCSLELGGKNPLLVLRDADVRRASEGAVRACFTSAGQVCVGAERIYVADTVYEKFVDSFLRRVKAMKLLPGCDWDSDMGSLTSRTQLERVGAHVKDALAHGAHVLVGGQARPDIGPFYYEPTVLEDVNASMLCGTVETFGPVVSLTRFRDEHEAITLANSGAYGLNASIYSKDTYRAAKIARHLTCGTININEAFGASFGSIDAPMGGMKDSGLGRRHGAEGIQRFTQTQTIATQRVTSLSVFADIDRKEYAETTTKTLKAFKRLGRP